MYAKNIYTNIYNFQIELLSIVALIFLVNHLCVFNHDIRWDHI